MDIPVTLQLGLTGRPCSLGKIRIDPAAIRIGSGVFGSYHVLAMGRHYEHYVVTNYLPKLTAIVGITTAHPMARIATKTRASSVTGNIGEVVAALTLRRKLRTSIRGVVHISTSRKYKTPDYLVRFQPVIPTEFGQVLPPTLKAQFSDWPTESKAAKTSGYANSATLDALAQLASYWYYREPYDNAVVGFGIIVTLTYESPRAIQVIVLAPRNQPSLISQINLHRTSDTYQDYLAEIETPGSSLRSTLYNV